MIARHKYFVRCFLLATVVALSAVAGFNLLVDPLGAFPKLHLDRFDPLRYLEGDRVAKAEMVRRGDWEVIILGSSRARTGFPADHPFVATNRCCNLGLDGARLSEIALVFDLARRKNPLQHVLLALDWYMTFRDTPWAPGFAESHFNPGFNAFEFYSQQLLGEGSTRRSWQTFWRKLRGDLPPLQMRNGFYDHRLDPRLAHRELFARMMRPTTTGYRRYEINELALDRFRHIVRACRDQHINLQIFIPPVHALDLEAQFARGNWPEFEEWKTRVVELLAQEGVEGKFGLWDFSSFTGPPAETLPPEGDTTSRMKYYLDSSHFTPACGRLVMDAILGRNATNEFGVKLTRANLQPHLARLRTEREAYVKTHAAEQQWVQRVVRGAAGEGNGSGLP